MKNKFKKWEKYCVPFWWLLIGIYGILCLYLYYMQSIQSLDYNNRYFQSDLPYHISMIIDDGWYYSFTAYIYQLLYWLGGNGTLLISVFLAAMSVLSVILTERLIRFLREDERISGLTLSAALGLNLVMAFFWSFAGQYRYVSYQSGNLWHNSTYLCMKVAALGAFIHYLKVEKDYRKKITLRQWLILAGLLFVCTGIKPSYLTVFAPVLAIKLLVDLCRRVPFKQVFLLGSTVLPSCGVVLWQNAVLFGAETGQGFSIDLWYTFSLHANKTKLAVLCSIAFPLMILLLSLKELIEDKKYLFAWGVTIVGFLEALCLVETGSRSRDGNFLWGYCIGIFLIFIFSFEKWLQLLKRTKHILFYRIAFLMAGLVLAYHVFCGIYFFIRLLQGETYFMQI